MCAHDLRGAFATFAVASGRYENTTSGLGRGFGGANHGAQRRAAIGTGERNRRLRRPQDDDRNCRNENTANEQTHTLAGGAVRSDEMGSHLADGLPRASARAATTCAERS